MKQSRRAIRMERHHKRNRTPALNLVSLMDIFTILVFFLLVNSSDGQVLPTSKSVELPQSFAETPPRHNIVVIVDGDTILIDGQKVSELENTLTKDSPISALTDYLAIEYQKITSQYKGTPPAQEITIMGDKSLPYHLLKRVMISCTNAGFERISFAVLQKSVGGKS